MPSARRSRPKKVLAKRSPGIKSRAESKRRKMRTRSGSTRRRQYRSTVTKSGRKSRKAISRRRRSMSRRGGRNYNSKRFRATIESTHETKMKFAKLLALYIVDPWSQLFSRYEPADKLLQDLELSKEEARRKKIEFDELFKIHEASLSRDLLWHYDTSFPRAATNGYKSTTLSVTTALKFMLIRDSGKCCLHCILPYTIKGVKVEDYISLLTTRPQPPMFSKYEQGFIKEVILGSEIVYIATKFRRKTIQEMIRDGSTKGHDPDIEPRYQIPESKLTSSFRFNIFFHLAHDKKQFEEDKEKWVVRYIKSNTELVELFSETNLSGFVITGTRRVLVDYDHKLEKQGVRVVYIEDSQNGWICGIVSDESIFEDAEGDVSTSSICEEMKSNMKDIWK